MEIDVTPVLGSQGELEYYLAIQRGISVNYTLEQRLRNHMILMEAVLNNIPAAVVAVDGQDRVAMDNLTCKTFCADCGGRELFTKLQVSPGRMTPGVEAILPVALRGAVRWPSVTCWPLSSVSEEASRCFIDSALTRTLVMIADCIQQHQQQEQGRFDRLKQQMTTGKLLAAIYESLDVALIQLNRPINMLAAVRRLNGEGSGNVALEAVWREGEEMMARLQRCRPSLELESPVVWPLQLFSDDLCTLYRIRFDPDGLQVDMASPHLIGFGQRIPLLACLSLWLDCTLTLAAESPSMPLAIQFYVEENDGWLSLHLIDSVPLLQVRYAYSSDVLNLPDKGMGLRLTQTLVAHHRGATELASRPQGGTCPTLRSPLFNILTGGEA